MIRLLIDGQDVVLPLDMKFDYFRENPFFFAEWRVHIRH